MRFAAALVALLAAVLLVLAGVAQRTVLKPSGHVEVAAAVPADVRYVVVPAAVLRAHPGQQTVRAAGSGTAFAAFGRSADLTAWLAGERYAELRVDADGRMLAPVVRTAPALRGMPSGGSPDPDGSDLWLDQRRSSGSLDWAVNLPASMSVLVAADGRTPAPSDVRVTWPVRTATPFAVPMIVAGGLLAVVGLLLYVWALVHVRRRRGPRRKPPAKLPRPPHPPRYRPQRPVATAPSRGRRSVRSTALRTATAVATAVAATVALGLPGGAATAEDRGPTASVGEDQAVRIIHRIATAAAEADGDRDAKKAAERFAGPALALRKAAYRIRAKDRKAALPQALPVEGATVGPILPQATGGWPRTLFAVVSGRAKTAPLALTMVQADPRSDYKVHYAMALMKGKRLPTLPSALDGASRLDAEARVLRMAPADIAGAYGMLLRDRDSDQAELFDVSEDQLAAGVGEAAKKKLKRKLGSTAGITFSDLPTDPDSVVAMSTADAGALVSVDLDEQWTVKPKRAGVTVTPGTGGTRILSKTSASSKGYGIVYGYQLLFSVPPAGSDQRAVLLGYAQGLVSAKEL